MALPSWLFKSVESVLNRKILKHLVIHSLLSYQQYELRKVRSPGSLLKFLIRYWSFPLRVICEIFPIALNISKAFDSVC